MRHMSRLADATICPDCRATLDPASTCTACGLRLAGSAGQRLWLSMLDADRLVEEIRAATPGASPVDTRVLPVAPCPVAPPVPSRPRTRRLPALSVPVVLLSLGALCLLVAALVFVALTWSVLGLTGRTLVLLGVTGLFAAAAAVVSRRGLRGAAESCWAIVAGMLTLDLLAGRAAGLAALDTLDGRSMSLLLGGALFAFGVGVALWARRTPVGTLVVPQVAAALGALVGAAGGAWAAPRPAVGAALAVPVLVALALPLLRRLSSLAVVLLGFAAFSWLELATLGLLRAGETSTWGAWWSDLRGWPLLVASAYAALATLPRRTPVQARVALAAMALAPLVVLANAPALPANLTIETLRAAGTVVLLAAVARLAARTWALAATALGLLAATGLAVLVAWEPWTSLNALPAVAGAGLRVPPVETAAAAWTWPVVAAGVVLMLFAPVRLAPPTRAPELRRLAVVASLGLLGLAVLVALLAARTPLWLATAAALAAAAAPAGVAWWRRLVWSPTVIATGSVAAGYLVLLGLAAALPSAVLTATASSALALVLAIGFVTSERRGEVVGPALTGGLAVLATTGALPAWGTTLDLAPATVALLLASYAGVVLLAAAPLTRRTSSRSTLELTTVVPAVLAVVLAPSLPSLAMTLTIIGTALAAVAVLNGDRRPVSWLGVAVLGCATLIRVVAEVRAPELYTLPAALLLLGAGLWRLRTDPESDSLGALGSGLTLALLPSLLLALGDPISVRGVLVGAAGVATLVLGVRERLCTPLLVGAGTTALLALRELQPLSEAVPRWVSLALLGLGLLAVGITWESRLRNLRAAGRYLGDLR